MMILMKNKTLRSTCCILACLSIVLSSIIPGNFAFALVDECGPHEIEICDEHGQSHFKLTHKRQHSSENAQLESVESAEDTASNVSKNHDHHVDSAQLLQVNRTKLRVETPPSFLALATHFCSNFSWTTEHFITSLEPPKRSTSTYLLKNVRLII